MCWAKDGGYSIVCLAHSTSILPNIMPIEALVWERCYSNSISELLDEKVGWKKGGKWEAKFKNQEDEAWKVDPLIDVPMWLRDCKAGIKTV